MPNRILKESVLTSDSISSLSDFEYRVWTCLILLADDAGRGDARPAIIKGRGFPLRERVTSKDIDAAVHGLAGKGCISLYTVGGKSYYYFPTWSEHQRVRDVKPKYPAPDDSAADCGELRQIAADCGLNPNPNPNTNPNPNITPYNPPSGDAFVDFAGEDQTLLEALKDFEAMRKKRRNPMTDRAKELLIGELVKQPPEQWIPMLNTATLKGWSSVYPPKREATEPQTSAKTVDSGRAKRLREREQAKHEEERDAE